MACIQSDILLYESIDEKTSMFPKIHSFHYPKIVTLNTIVFCINRFMFCKFIQKLRSWFQFNLAWLDTKIIYSIFISIRWILKKKNRKHGIGWNVIPLYEVKYANRNWTSSHTWVTNKFRQCERNLYSHYTSRPCIYNDKIGQWPIPPLHQLLRMFHSVPLHWVGKYCAVLKFAYMVHPHPWDSVTSVSSRIPGAFVSSLGYTDP